MIEERLEDKLKTYKTINGSDSFQVVVLTPNSTILRAAPYLCICRKCKVRYGTCSRFTEYELVIQTNNKPSLHSEIQSPGIEGDEDDTVLDFVQVGTVCAIPADGKSCETVMFIKILAHHTNDSEDQYLTDDWGQDIAGARLFRR